MTQKHDTQPLVMLADLTAATGLLSRLPVPVDPEQATARGALAAWAYPVAGLAVAVPAAILAQATLWVGLPAPLVAGLALVCLVVMTGAMHEDGLADSADGLWGGWDTARRLDIMKDSRIGAYGVIALVLGLGLRWQALTVIIAQDRLWATLICTAMLSRATMVALMAHLPHARTGGLSKSVGRPDQRTAGIAIGLGLIPTLLLFHLSALWLILAASAAGLACARIARAKIGGQTGDILGATQQITEIAILLTLAALL